MTPEGHAEIRKLQDRAREVASAATKADIANDVPDLVYIVIAVRQLGEEFALGSYVSHTNAMVIDNRGVKLILKTALDTVGHEVPS